MEARGEAMVGWACKLVQGLWSRLTGYSICRMPQLTAA